MKISKIKYDIALARTGKLENELNIPQQSLRRMKRGFDVRPSTVGKLARSLGVDPSELIEHENVTAL